MSDSKKRGWVRLHRQIDDNFLWFLEPFTKAQAWIDLFMHANHKDGCIDIRGNLIEIKRGQLGWSELTMAKRWKWSRNKVRRFLKLLKTKQQIEQQKTPQTTLITILNYDLYQLDETTNETTERQQKDNRKTTESTQTRMYKNEKNEKKEEASINFLNNIQPGDIKEFQTKLSISEQQIKDKAEELYDYCQSKGRKYKNYKALLRNAIRRDFKNKQKQHEPGKPFFK